MRTRESENYEDEADWARRRVKCNTPELRLAAAVMGEVVSDLTLGPPERRPGIRTRSEFNSAYASARRWVESNAMHVNSFTYLCDLFDLDREVTRQTLLAIKPQPGARRDLGLRTYVKQAPRPIEQRPPSRRSSWFKIEGV